MDEKDREIQELRRQVESLKAEVVKRGKWIEFKRTYLECRCSICGWEVAEKSDFCPYCGGKAQYFEERIFVSPLRNVSWKGVKCKRCGGSYIDANLNTCSNDMIKAWNRRTDNGDA